MHGILKAKSAFKYSIKFQQLLHEIIFSSIPVVYATKSHLIEIVSIVIEIVHNLHYLTFSLF